MKTIGMIAAVELKAVLAQYGAQTSEAMIAGYRVLEYELPEYWLVVVNCGAGEIAAASGTQFLISQYHAEAIVNFGVVGGLTEEMSRTKLCIVEKAVHYDFDTSAADNTEAGRYLQYPDVYIPADAGLLQKAKQVCPELRTVICASGDQFVADPERKRELHRLYRADICEMEAAGILLTCNRNGVPCLLVKAVSDGITGGAAEFHATIEAAAALCLNTVRRILAQL